VALKKNLTPGIYFYFLDPLAFMDGKTQDLLTTDLQGESLGQVGTEGDDWANYYVGMYVNCHQQTNQLLTVSSSLYSFVDDFAVSETSAKQQQSLL
jgi:hypothetical protein